MTMPERFAAEVEAAVSAEPVDGILMLQRVRARESTGRRSVVRRTGAVVLAVTAVLGVAVGAPQLLADDETPDRPPAVAVAPAPPGQRAVSWHGVQVFVPAAWKLDDLYCHVPQSDTVIVPGIRNDCLPPPVPGLTVVTFADSQAAPLDAALAATSPTRVSGRPAMRGVTTPVDEPSSTLAVLHLPELDVTVTVRSPDPERAGALLDTAQVVEADPTGCPSTLPGSSPPTPAVPGAAERVLPGTPTVALCNYGDLRLEQAGRMSEQAVRDFQAALDKAPVGQTPSRVGISVVPELCPEYDRSPLVLLATYDDGASLQVFTRLNSCTGPDPANGLRQVRIDQDAVFAVYRALYESRQQPG